MTVDLDSTEALKEEVARLTRENEELTAEKAALEGALTARGHDRASVHSAAFEQIPIAIGIFARDGLLTELNAAGERMFGTPREQTVGHFNPLVDPQAIAIGTPAVFAKVLDGEAVTIPPYKYDTTQLEYRSGRVLWVETLYSPIFQGDGTVSHILTMNRDVTTQMNQEAALEAATREVEARQREVAAQKETIAALSSPVIQVWEGILTIPLIGVVDEHRVAMLNEDLLGAIVQHRAECVILDVTGVAQMDVDVANHLVATTRACRLLGCQVALVGISGDTAQKIVHLGVDLSGIVTRANLRAGIAWAFERRGLTVVSVPR